MKKVIDGKLYNTETATLCGSYSNGYSYNDFQFCAERLYRTKKGQFFLHGEGGPMSAYSESYGNMSCGGEGIRLLALDEAREWGQEHLSADRYVNAFGEVEEG